MDARTDSFAVGPRPRVIIECDRGSITVRAGTDGAVGVETRLRRPELIEYTAESAGDIIRIRAMTRPGVGGLGALFTLPGQAPRADIAVNAPGGSSIEIRASNATIDVAGMSGGVRAQASNGRVSVADCRGDVEIVTSNGAIDAERVEGRLNARATNGAITGREIAGTVELRTTNGRIDLDLRLAPGSASSVRTTNGSVRVGLATGDVVVTASSTNGTTNVEVPNAGPGAERATLEVRTTNGSVRVHRIDRAVGAPTS